jgi:asparagine synthase (glutamine-hydrolysing)
MCGIAGVWRIDGGPVDADELRAARDRLTNRGPDDAGLHVEGSVGLAHRRLSIIDLSPAGRMPMSNEHDDIWAVFNGEIYNFAELRSQLESKGHTFRSRTDSEVAIHAYEEWGTGCFARFEGMFAIAIWDRKARRLVLARDRAGEKPLYYYADRALVAFASTVSALLAFPAIAREVDPASLRLYAEFGYVPAPRCIVRGVAKVEPGSVVVFEHGREPVAHRYWRFEQAALESRPARDLSLAGAADQLQSLLRDAVRARLVSDVPLGAFLSGGIDSSVVVALMAEVGASSVRTFTIGFEDPRFDESGHAQRIAQHLGVTNTTLVLSPAEVLRELPTVTRAFDEPMADYSALPSLAVARLARQHVTVALSGDGADEAFGGYRYYAGTRLFERMAAVIPTAVRGQLAKTARFAPSARLRRAIARGSAIDAAAYFGRSGFYRGSTAGAALQRVLPPVPGHRSPEDTVAAYVRALSRLTATEAGMLWDATHTLPDAWLTKVDRTTMAVGLEARAPFLDRKVLEFAFGIPLRLRVHGTEKKIVLREVLARYLPRKLFDRPKQGFTAPLRSWFAKELRDELHDRLAPQRIARFGIFDPAGVQQVLADQMSGRGDHTQLLWALFHLDSWHEAYIESPQASIK